MTGRVRQASTASMGTNSSTKLGETTVVVFPEWREALAAARMSATAERARSAEIIAFLSVCKAQRAPATVALVRR